MIRLTQTASLQQKMAPQLIQSLRLLQMPSLELEQLIQQELEINPLLEISEEPEQEEEEWDLEEEEEAKDDTSDSEDEPEPESEDEPKLEELEFDDADMDDGQFDEEDWNDYLNDSGYSTPQEEFDPNIEEWENDGANQQSLEEELNEQLLLTDLSDDERVIGQYIIGNIDEDGFLRSQIEDIAIVLGVDPQGAERVLQVIQTFDPPGVGSRDLRECLMIQLCEQDLAESLAMRIVTDYLDDLVNRRYSKICRALSVEREAIAEAEVIISGLNPKPMIYREEKINHNLVVPDLEVQKVGEEYVVSLTDRNIPSLRVSPTYRALLTQSEKAGKEAKKFVVDRLNSARWFISAINQRRTTMLKVMRCIVENQIDFFDQGQGHLKPMVLQEVADRVSMHVSTISRVSNGKYVQTHHGVYELKYFFDGGLSRDDGGEDISAKSVKDKIAKLIDEEDPKSPLSDQRIADLLKAEGIDIARRTVAKYRDQLRINPGRYRKSI
ncbi:MAG TPA: RNA polymerase sigma-54 factor [Candidatus Latescibacteria bacterium]|nr:RNA polymerase sigma-54 factor [Candidatus Latescibacterota bacterium]|tara:strand:- start:901 stop:2388 length:1488 start_codon:yes stop_codon:yes gene_type:complete